LNNAEITPPSISNHSCDGTKWLGAAYFLACLLVFIRDEFLRPESRDQWAIINLIPHFSLAWWLAGALTLLCIWLFEASFRINKHLEAEKAEIEARFRAETEKRARLSIGDPYFVLDEWSDVCWKIKIHNSGASAAHVQMNLCDISPPPKNQVWAADYPYRIVQPGLTLDLNECQINRGNDAIFDLTRVCEAANRTGFLMTLDTRMPGSQVQIEQEEQWEMKYEVTAENADKVELALQMTANTKGIVLKRIPRLP
jgi:hypothetical protein